MRWTRHIWEKAATFSRSFGHLGLRGAAIDAIHHIEITIEEVAAASDRPEEDSSTDLA